METPPRGVAVKSYPPKDGTESVPEFCEAS